MYGRFRFFLLAAVVLLGFNHQVAMGASKLKREHLLKLFDSGWQASSESFDEMTEFYEELLAETSSDVRVRYAYMLILLKRHKITDAEKLLDELVEERPDDLHVWRTRVWMSVVRQRYAQALVQIEKFSELIPSKDDPTEKKDELYRESAAFLGRIFGYLENPVASSVPETQRVTLRKKITERMSPRRKEVFEEARQAVTDRFLELSDDKLATKEKVKEEAEAEREETLKDLEQEREKLTKRGEELESRRSKLQDELKSQVNELSKKDTPLKNQFIRLDADVAGIRRELDILVGQIAALQRRLAIEKDPVNRELLNRDIGRLQATARRFDGDLVAASRQADAIAAQRNDLRNQAAQLETTYGRQIDTINKEIRDIDKKLGRNSNIEKKARKPVPTDSPQVRAKASLLNSLSTYEQYPFEQEKQRVLDAVK